MRLWTVFMLMAACAFVANPGKADEHTIPVPLTGDDASAWLDGFIPFAIQRGDVAGAVVVVVRNGEIIVQKGYGFANRERMVPVDPQRTLFRIGSIAKLFTWTAVMQLVEAGRLDLDVDINNYLDFVVPPRQGMPVTLRNLMTHTPGFEEVIRNLLADEVEGLQPLEDYLKTWVPERIHPPGEVPAYSNYGASLAGYIVQRVSGEAFDDYIDRHVFTPLGMQNSSTRQPLPEELAQNLSSGYRLGSGPAQPFEFVSSAPAGSASSTGADMANFMMAYLQQGRFKGVEILEPATVRLMLGTEYPLLPPLNGMLLGFMQQNLEERRIVGHGGDTWFFHSSLDLFLDEDVGLFLSLNSSGRDGAAHYIRSALVGEFADRYFPRSADHKQLDPALAKEHAQLMKGEYKSSRRAQSSFMSLANLLSQTFVDVDENGDMRITGIPAFDGQPMAWREISPFVWEQVYGRERLAAKLVDGKVVMFSVDSASPFDVFQPVKWWESSRLLIPLLTTAISAIVLTLFGWIVAAITRRYYGVAFGLSGIDASVYRWLRLVSVGVLIVLIGWLSIVSLLSSNLFGFTPELDIWLLILQSFSLLIASSGTLLALWNARLAWVGRRSWGSRVWGVILVLSFFTIVWVAFVFGLLELNTRY